MHKYYAKVTDYYGVLTLYVLEAETFHCVYAQTHCELQPERLRQKLTHLALTDNINGWNDNNQRVVAEWEEIEPWVQSLRTIVEVKNGEIFTYPDRMSAASLLK